MLLMPSTIMLAVAKTSVAFRSMWRRNELRVANNDAALSWRWELTHSHRHVFGRCYEDINICELSKALKCGPHIPPLILVQGRVKKKKTLSTKHLLPIKKGATVKATYISTHCREMSTVLTDGFLLFWTSLQYLCWCTEFSPFLDERSKCCG